MSFFVKKNTSNAFVSVFCFTFRRCRTVSWDHCMVHRPRSIILPTVGGHNHYHCLVLKVSTMFISTVNQIYNIIYSLTCNWSVVLLTARYIICQLILFFMTHWPSPSLRWYMTGNQYQISIITSNNITSLGKQKTNCILSSFYVYTI